MGEEVVKETDSEAVSKKENIYASLSLEKGIQGHVAEEPRGRLFAMEEKWKLIYNENHRSPTYAVSHYISYLRRYVSATSQLRVIVSGKTTERFSRKEEFYDRADTKPMAKDTQRSLDSISPMSYFIRKLKLDLKMAYVGFVEEFIEAPSNGLRLLLTLLKNLQVLASSPGQGLFTKTGPKGTLKMEEYKKNMVDEQDCLLCIKYTLRVGRAVEELLDNNPGLFTVTDCVLSNYSRSRITALEILTLLLTGPSSVDRVLDAFTSMRIKHAESCRFKMLVNMLYTRGVSHVLFQVGCLRMLNTLVNLCKSANMRVFLQYEVEEAGLDLARIEQNAVGDGLEYDDLRKEIQEWRMRYIDVDSILRKMKADLRMDAPGTAVSEFHYDQHFGRRFDSTVDGIDLVGLRTNPEHVPNWREVYSHSEDRTAQRSHPVYPGPPLQANSQSDPPLHNNATPNITYTDPSGGGPQQQQHTVLNILSRTPSPGNPHPTQALDNARSGTISRDFSAGKFSTVTTELWEPCGLVIKPEGPGPVVPLPSESRGLEEQPSDNWVFGSTVPSCPRDSKQSGAGVTRDCAVLSNVYYSSDGESQDTTKRQGVQNAQKVRKDTSRLFYSPKDSGLESGPLRWFNPGITVPPSPSSSGKASSDHNSAANKKTDSSKDKATRKPYVTSPKHMRTPPPDYNDSDNEDHLEISLDLRRRSSMPTTSIAASSQLKESQKSSSEMQSSVPSEQHRRQRPGTSNFLRWPPVRRKSFSEISKQSSQQEEPPHTGVHVSSAEFDEPPPLPPPRVVHPPPRPMSPVPTFQFGCASESDRTAAKPPANRYIKHGESRPPAPVKTPSPDYSPSSLHGQAQAQASSHGTENTHVISKSKSFSEKKIPTDSATNQTALFHASANKGVYSLGIPSSRSPRASRVTSPEPVTSRAVRSGTPEHKMTAPTVPSRDSQMVVSKSTIVISSSKNSSACSETTKGAVSQSYKQTNDTFLNVNRQVSDRSYAVAGPTKSSNVSTVTGDKQLNNGHSVGSEAPSYRPMSPQASQAATAISYPPPHASSINDIIANLIRSKPPPTIFLNDSKIPHHPPSAVIHIQKAGNEKSQKQQSERSNHQLSQSNAPNTNNTPNAQASLNQPQPKKAGESAASDASSPKETLLSSRSRRQDSEISYSSEIGRVLGDLDHALEAQEWQATLRRQPQAALVAYV